MPRLPYLPADLAEPADLVAAIRKRRGGALIELDRQLLYSPPVARGWNALLGAVRGELSLSPKLRELAMCAVAVLNRAEYEFVHHAPEFIKAGGSQAQADALRDIDQAAADGRLFDAVEQATLRLSIEMTRHVKVADKTFESVRQALPDQRAVFELVATIAAYNMVSRVLVALEVEARP
jgi:alkylhydroperoxidase family enzyme